MKVCTKCGEEKLLNDFYRRRASNDRLCPLCKVCDSKKRAAHYAANWDRYRSIRANREYTVEEKKEKSAKQRIRNARNKERLKAYNKAWYLSHRKQMKAKGVVQYAKKTGTLVPLPCEVCDTTENIEAHHDDYDKPLDIRWLCRSHHKRLHSEFKRTQA